MKSRSVDNTIEQQEKTFMKQIQLEQLKQIELDILKQFIEVCQKLNLTYFVLGGTMLGAVRHKGFIPWDDDIDVGMPRQDYEVFLQKAQALLPESYFLQTHKTDPEYPLNFAKIRNSNTTFIESSMANRNINHGVYIDVFPLDFYPDSKLQQSLFDIRLKLLHFRMRSEFVIPKEYKASVLKKAVQNGLMGLAKLIFPSAQKAIEKREKLMKSYTHTSFLANFCGAWGKREIVPASWYGEGKVCSFENLSVRIPVQAEKWLTQVYGNYRQLPPKEKQISHHYTDKIDLEHSYKNFMQGK